MNPQFQKFLKHLADEKRQMAQIPRLKVLERERKRIAFANYNYNSIRSGSSLSASSVCEKERAIEAFKNLMATFRSSSSSTLA